MEVIKGTCIQTYIPMRSGPDSGAEMVSSILFGESYDVTGRQDDWLHVRTDFDNYEGWISGNTFQEHISYTRVVDTDYVEAFTKGEKMLIPCGGLIPEDHKMSLNGKQFELKFNLKPNHHLPVKLRLVNTAKAFLNTPYLWGGRCFMGIDCSGFVQVVFKASDIKLPRDTSMQINEGTGIAYNELQSGDLVFFRKPGAEKVSHVGLMINASEIIHASGKVRIDKLSPKGIMIDHKLAYEIMELKRIVA